MTPRGFIVGLKRKLIDVHAYLYPNGQFELYLGGLDRTVVSAAGLGADERLGALGERCQAVGRDAGWAKDPADHAERPGRLQGGSLSGRGHHAMVHRRHRRLQRVHQGKKPFQINRSFLFFFFLPRSITRSNFFFSSVNKCNIRIMSFANYQQLLW